METIIERGDLLHPDTTSSLCLPSQGMSRAKEILPFLPFGTTTLWQWSKDGRFPAPVKVSESVTAWRNSDVIAWLDSFSQAEGGLS